MSSRARVVVGVVVGVLVVALVVVLVAYKRVAAEKEKLASDRDALCRTRASQLASLVSDKPQLDVRHQVKKLTDQWVSTICLGEAMPVPITEAERCWAQTQADSCYVGYAEKLLPLYNARGWR